MTLAADSSIAISALLADHVAHDSASEALASCVTTIAHVAAETYSVLTRLPPPRRVDPLDAAVILAARLPARHVTLAADNCATAPTRLAQVDVSGGATYDGLIALTAMEHDLELVTRDRRAVRTYRALGAHFQLLS